jgi:hypothetical protein
VTQIIAREGPLVEIEELYIILREKLQQEEKSFEDMEKQYHLFENLNPRFQEGIIPIEDARLKIESSDIVYSTRWNIFRAF